MMLGRLPSTLSASPLRGIRAGLLAALITNSAFSQEGPAEAEAVPPATAPVDDGYAQVELLLHAMEIVREHYVDEAKVSYESLVNHALAGMLEALDPHSQFLYPELYQQVKDTLTEGTYDGVGLAVAPKNNVLSIVSVREDGPAARAGVLPGDQIVQIGDKVAKGMPIVDAVQMLRGRPGERMKLILRRPATGELKSVEILREVIKEETVKDVMLVPASLAGRRKIGYARLLQFNEPTAGELRDALDQLEDDGMEAFVLDLRNNPGGLIDSAVNVCGEFVPPETLIATTEGRVRAHDRPPYRTASRKQRERTYPVAVLVNHSSASGSELVAGALQDLNRAVIVGETTFGKGSVQSIVPMPQGTALRLTVAKYYTPEKWTIHERGVQPDIVATLTPEEEERVFEWWSGNRVGVGAGDESPDLAAIGDRQLLRAVDALKGVLVLRGPNQNRHRHRQEKSRVKQPSRILALETSCDETAVAVIEGTQVLASEISSQVPLHRPYGGIVPELASRNHVINVAPLVRQALANARCSLDDIDAFAATSGPGLASSLLIGNTVAKALAATVGRPYLAINHMEGHLLSPFLSANVEPCQCIGLIVSGGHTMLIQMDGVGDYTLLGRTRDDAAGEAFDKVAKMLDLPYPGGPEIDRLARPGNAAAYDFPRSMMHSGDFAFSFSGLKTSVLYKLSDLRAQLPRDQWLPDICASFQEAVVDVLVAKAIDALETNGLNCLTVSGGVACNSRLRAALESRCDKEGFQLLLPSPDLTTDNAAMIAYVAGLKFAAGFRSELAEDINPNLALT